MFVSAYLASGCSCGDSTTLDAGLRLDATVRDAGPGLRDTGPGLRDAGPGRRDAGYDAGFDAGVDAGPGAVRFVVMGDTGEGNEAQREVGVQIRDLCAAEGCDFVMILGDNIYDEGVDSVTDPQWQNKFEVPYADIDLPFYPVLGNHDYGRFCPEILGEPICVPSTGGAGSDWELGQIEVDYTAVSDKWTLPDTFYTLQLENVGFVMLDTNSLVWGNTDNGDQEAWFAGAVADLRASGADWIMVAGHHPLRSNGRHGNAGSYDSLDVDIIGEIDIPSRTASGTRVRDFFRDFACGSIDVYFAGHDHNRQWIEEPGACDGAALFVSGAGSKVTGFDDTNRNATRFQDDSIPGFLYVRVEGDTFYGRMVNRDGVVEYEDTFLRRGVGP